MDFVDKNSFFTSCLIKMDHVDLSWLTSQDHFKDWSVIYSQTEQRKGIRKLFYQIKCHAIRSRVKSKIFKESKIKRCLLKLLLSECRECYNGQNPSIYLKLFSEHGQISNFESTYT